MKKYLCPEELIELRRHLARRPVTESELPPTVEAAYDVAVSVVGLLGAEVAAWKLGATTTATRLTFAATQIYFGALLSQEVWSVNENSLPPVPLILRGEAEIAFRLSADIDSDDIDVALAAPPTQLFDAWAPAIEAPYSCLTNVVDLGLRALLIDRCSAGALYLGAPRPDITDDGIDQSLQIFVDGSCVSQGSAKAALLMTPLNAALGFLKIASAQRLNLRRGQWISTGGITPCVTLPFHQTFSLVFGGQTEFDLCLEEPTQ